MASLSEAIAREEGWLIPDSRCRRNNNPGNIEYGKFSIAHGATGGDPRFAIFPTADEGFACLAALLKTGYVGLTLAQAIAKWAPDTENNTAEYVANVCLWTGLTPETVVTPDVISPVISPKPPPVGGNGGGGAPPLPGPQPPQPVEG
jgi:hypothetical protein